jgi:hypothetical protein
MWHVCQEKPRDGETVDRLYKRLKRLAKKYQQEGRYFRVRRVGDIVLWERVPEGLHTRLGRWHNLKTGEHFETPIFDAALELKQAKASARYLKAAGKGQFSVRLHDGQLRVMRVS